MARYEITRRCGHEDTVRLFGPQWQRDYAIRSEQQRDCPDCIASRRKQVSANAAELAQLAGWPTLTGSPRQVAWGQTIRADAIAKVAEDLAGYPQRLTDLFTVALLRQTDAGWWINERDFLVWRDRNVRKLLTGDERAEAGRIHRSNRPTK